MKRVWLGEPQMDGRPWAAAQGVAGEDYETEIYHPYGFSAGVEGEGIHMPMNDSDDNHTALPPRGDRMAASGTVLIYFGTDTEIELSDGKIAIRCGGKVLTIEGGRLTTDLDIETSGDVVASGISLKSHRHGQVQPGSGTSGVWV